MLIAFTAVNPGGEIQKFMCQLATLEAGLDMVSLIATRGNRLLDTVLIDGESITPLRSWLVATFATAILVIQHIST